MGEARSKVQWSHTSAVLALLANINRDPKKHPSPFTVDQFNPHAPKRSKKETIKTVTMGELQALIPDLPGVMAKQT